MTTFCIAILGAESTGKTALAQALAAALALETGLRCTWVPEHLRAWCERAGRTPQQGEQAGIAQAQHAHIAQAAASFDVVVSDTTALQTAVYSRIVFADCSLDASAIELHRNMHVTLLTALDLPWVADGLQRSGEQVRAPVDAALRDLLLAGGLPWALVAGSGPARLQAALDAVAPLLRRHATPRAGLFTRLAQRNAQPQARTWQCERCDDPACEHLSVGRPPGPFPTR